MTLRGQPIEHSFRAALTTVGSVQLELIQPLDGPSLYTEHLEAHGEGVHHIGFAVEDFAAARDRLRALGCAEIQGGRTFETGEYVYADTTEAFGVLTEMGRREPGASLPPPHSTYP